MTAAARSSSPLQASNAAAVQLPSPQPPAHVCTLSVSRRVDDEDEACPKRARVESLDKAFDSLARLVLYQRDDRHAAAAAETRLRQALGVDMLTPSAILGAADGSAGLARRMGQEQWHAKGQAILNLASAWVSLDACPRVRRGPRDATDVVFERAVKRVSGIGPWTVGQFFIGIGRTDVLMSECYEVKQGLNHLLTSECAIQISVKAWAAARRFRSDALTHVTHILRDVHRCEQGVRGTSARDTEMRRVCAGARDQLDALVGERA